MTTDSRVISKERETELQNGYSSKLRVGDQNIPVTILAEQDDVDARLHAIQGKLEALGVTDITQEGSLVLGGALEATPGLLRGVTFSGTLPGVDTRTDLSTVPEILEYTRAERWSPTTSLLRKTEPDRAVTAAAEAGPDRVSAGPGPAAFDPGRDRWQREQSRTLYTARSTLLAS